MERKVKQENAAPTAMLQAIGDAAHTFKPGTQLHEEDGWIFRERPGIGIECLGRTGEVLPHHCNPHGNVDAISDQTEPY